MANVTEVNENIEEFEHLEPLHSSTHEDNEDTNDLIGIPIDNEFEYIGRRPQISDISNGPNASIEEPQEIEIEDSPSQHLNEVLGIIFPEEYLNIEKTSNNVPSHDSEYGESAIFNIYPTSECSEFEDLIQRSRKRSRYNPNIFKRVEDESRRESRVSQFLNSNLTSPVEGITTDETSSHDEDSLELEFRRSKK